MVAVQFNVVSVPISPDQVIYVVGNCLELGQWCHEKAVMLGQSISQHDEDSHWSLAAELKTTERLEYRYFVGKLCSLTDNNNTDDGQSESFVTVQAWEGGTVPRTIDLTGDKNQIVNDVFGTIGDASVLYPGWLTKQYEIRLNFHDNPFVTLGKGLSLPDGYRIKCLPLDVSQDTIKPLWDENHGNGIADEIQYLDLKKDHFQFQEQPKFGALFKPDSYLIFRTQTIVPQHLGICIKVYAECTDSEKDLSLIGSVLVLPANISQGSSGVLQLPILSTELRTRGQITLNYLVVKPLASYRGNMSTSETLEWPHGPATLDMGHRGMGTCSASHMPPYCKENTIQSFNQAAAHGVDYVELDVQLTKDLVPVVFHDFRCRLPCPSIKGGEDSWHDVPVQSLTYKQVQHLKVGFSKESEMHKQEECSDGSMLEGSHLFPTMIEVLDGVNAAVGLFIEFKYPMKLISGKLEDDLTLPTDMNEYIDKILESILSRVGQRNMILTSFHPDVCVMLRLKQNRLPVSFHTQEKTARYEQFLDPRALDIHTAFKLAKAEHFLGVNPISETILNDLSLIQKANDLDIVLMCWGCENKDETVLKTLKDNGVQAVIFDNVDKLISPEKYGRHTNTIGRSSSEHSYMKSVSADEQ